MRAECRFARRGGGNDGRLRPVAAGFILLGLVSGLAAGCCERPPFNQELLALERFSGANATAALFSPTPAAGTAAAPSAPLPPMAWFNDRAPWPAGGATPLGEITFYRERYYDAQNSYTAGRGYVNDYVHRYFEAYRTGALVR